MNTKIILPIVLAILGVGALSGTLYVNNYIEGELDAGIHDLLVVNPDDAESYANWLTSEDADDAPLYKKYYLWDLTNPDAFLAGSKPIMEEKGPYVYRQYDRKIDVSFDDDEVTYKTYTYYIFDEDLSCSTCSIGDEITNVNPQYLGVLAQAGSEAALVTGFVGPTITQVVDGLTGDFVDGVKVQGAAAALETVVAGLTTDFVQGVLVQGAATAIDTIFQGLQTDFTQGVQVQGAAATVETISAGLTGDFAQGVLLKAFPDVLLGVQSGVTENFEFAVNATTVAGYLKNAWVTIESGSDPITANAQLFNSTDFSTGTFAGFGIESVSEWATNGQLNLGYSNATIDKLLHTGPGIGGIPGWLGDTDSGMGVLGFLKLYENATNNLGGLNNDTLQFLYGADQPLLDAAAGYLLNLCENNATINAATIGAKGATAKVIAPTMFYDQWANATYLPGGADISGDGHADGFELSLLIDSNITLATAMNLFDPTNGYALTNATGIGVWFQSALDAQEANYTIHTNLATAFSLSADQMNLIYGWLVGFKDGITQGQVILQFSPYGVTNLDDVGYLQWGMNATGVSLLSLDPTLGYPAEFWHWSKTFDTGISLNLTNSRALLTGDYNLANTTAAGTFLTLAATADVATINALFGSKLELTEMAKVAAYLQYTMGSFVLGQMPFATWDEFAFFHFGNGAATSNYGLFDAEATPAQAEFWDWSMDIEGSNATLLQSDVEGLMSGPSLNLTSSTGVGAFLLHAAMGNITGINALFGTNLDLTQMALLVGYIQHIQSAFVVASFAPVGVTTATDLGYLQFGSDVIGAGSLLDLETPLPGEAEFWAWSARTAVGTPGYMLDLATSKAILSGDNTMTNMTNLGTFLALAAGADFTTIEALWGLNSSEAVAFAGYLTYMMDTFVLTSFAPYGVSTWDDVAYLQWATPYVSGVSLFKLQPSLGFFPELWTHARNVSESPYEFTLAKAKAVLTGTYSLLDSTNAGMFLVLAGSGASGLTQINTLWGLNATDVGALAAWLQYLMAGPITAVLTPVFAAGGGLITTRTVNEWLWDYSDPLLEFLVANGQDLDTSANFFGNDTSEDDAREGLSNTYNTGKNDINKVGQYIKYQESTTVDVWASSEHVRGTGGTQFAPDVDEADTLVAWVGDLLRAVDFVYQSDVVVEGIDLLKFVLAAKTLGSSAEYAENAKYYQGVKGLGNMTAAIGAPLFLSKPHFLDGAGYLSDLAGVNPVRADHDTYLSVEPTSGAVFDARKRLQINLDVTPSNFFTTTVYDAFVPVIWIEEGATIPKDSAESFKDVVYSAQNIQENTASYLPAMGVLLIFAAVFTTKRAL
ncbi:MAG: hypothetical protein INQ03_25980 [Candidatus Heimdallarchaeota archaeon]|nr:hypothetical protein [Candidatus Heimdallarchaeota archaeon]